MSADRSDLRAEQVEALAVALCRENYGTGWETLEEWRREEWRHEARALAPYVAAMLADATAEAERQRDAVVAAVEGLVREYDNAAPDWWPRSMDDLRDTLAAARPAERERGGA